MSSIADWFSMDGNVALITGGSKGLGKAMGEALAKAGADLVLVSRDSQRLEATSAELREKTGRRVEWIAADVTDSAHVKKAVHDAIQTMGHVDILINSAGINIRKPIEAFTEEEWHKVIDTNLTGTFLFCKELGPHMTQRGYGRVINVGSILSSFGLAERTAYCSSKGGVLQLTRTLALEWAPYNVTVNAICPGFFATELNVPVMQNKEVYERLCAKIPLGRFAQPEEIQSATLFLASRASGYVTGSTLYVDGGVTAEV